ncbi:RNA-processing protein [Candidatus Bathyarchaeota archaeon]|nr:RNA-processing protein [Candidatus Bathyarchaeota archaeon]
MQTKFNVTIPQDRIGALVGEEGEIKQRIESTFRAKLNINSESGIVELTLVSEEGDAASLLKARDIVTAMGRGFSPDRAFALRDDEIILDIIDLREIFGRNEDTISRIKGRVIGRGGKTRILIEELTRTDVSIYGHTISLIGDYDSISIAREATLLLLEGKQHSTVYKFLRQRRREQKIKKITELWEPTK